MRHATCGEPIMIKKNELIQSVQSNSRMCEKIIKGPQGEEVKNGEFRGGGASNMLLVWI